MHASCQQSPSDQGDKMFGYQLQVQNKTGKPKKSHHKSRVCMLWECALPSVKNSSLKSLEPKMDPIQTTKRSFKYDLMVFILTNKALSVTYFTKINVFLQTWSRGRAYKTGLWKQRDLLVKAMYSTCPELHKSQEAVWKVLGIAERNSPSFCRPLFIQKKRSGGGEGSPPKKENKNLSLLETPNQTTKKNTPPSHQTNQTTKKNNPPSHQLKKIIFFKNKRQCRDCLLEHQKLQKWTI